MEKSRLSFMTFFLIMLFMTTTIKGISDCEMQRQVGHQRYMTIWNVMHRLRKMMEKRDELYVLTDMVEFDEGCFKTTFKQKINSPPQKWISGK